MKLLKEIKEFTVRGNVIDMAIGVIIGVAFGNIVSSIVGDILMPVFGYLLGDVDFSNYFIVLKNGAHEFDYKTLAEAKKAGAVTINYGVFIDTVIRFLIIALCLFFVVRGFNRLNRKSKHEAVAPDTKICPHCFSTINIRANRCPLCTSDLTNDRIKDMDQ